MSTPNNYFLQAILPNIPSQLYKPVLESSTLQMISTEAIKVNEDLVKSKENTKQKKFDINAQGSILAILESEEESEISDQSFQLLEKIFNSMQIKSTDINYLKQWGKDLNQDMLRSQLLPTKTRIIFLVGTLTTQQFLGKDKKISLTQGQIFELMSLGESRFLEIHQAYLSKHPSLQQQ